MEAFMLAYGEDLQVLVFFGMMFGLLGIERLIPRRTEREGWRRWRTNMFLSVGAILSILLVPVSFVAVAIWAKAEGLGLLNWGGAHLPIWSLIVLTLFLRGFISFATHYLTHKVPILWRLHRVHHMDTELDVSSTIRFHPLEMPVTALLGLPMVVAFGLSPWVLLIYELLDASITVFSHANIRVWPRLNRLLRYLIVTPDLHRVHHSSRPLETDSNFSAVFPIWDILCGTFRTETREPQETMSLGISEVRSGQAQNFWWLLISPFVDLKAANTRHEATVKPEVVT